MRQSSTRSNVALSLIFASLACTSGSVAITGDWYATRTLKDVSTDKTEYHLVLSENGTCTIESERFRKHDDQDYWADIAGSELKFNGTWSQSEDGKTITFKMATDSDVGLQRLDGMELTVSDDGTTLTRSDINAKASLLVFKRSAP